jgi:phosphomannomutase
LLDIGIASTPMTYFAIGSQECDGGLCVTASHNGPRYNGMKLCREGARPISGETGIDEVEAMCAADYPAVVEQRGAVERIDLMEEYVSHVTAFDTMQSEVSIAIDAANGMAGYTLPGILRRLPHVRPHTLLMDPDGTFPNHEANPIKEENLDLVRQEVLAQGAQMGVGFDGDADRCCFVDETGRTVPADLMTALLAREVLRQRPGVPVVYDLRSSWTVKEVIKAEGGEPIRERVGHSFIKATMRERGAVFAGELSGHFYFADNFTTDSGVLAMLSCLNLLSERASEGTTFSGLVEELRRYHATGEINFRVEDKAAAIALLRETFADGQQDDLDGITVEFGELGDDSWWWFNVRASNTEPLLRLNLEASHAGLRDEHRDQLISLLGKPEV